MNKLPRCETRAVSWLFWFVIRVRVLCLQRSVHTIADLKVKFA